MSVVRIDLVDSDVGSAEELAARTRNLRQELLELDVDDVRPAPAGAPPPGSRALDAQTIDSLLVTLEHSLPLATAVLETVKQWVGRTRQPSCTVKITVGDNSLEISGASGANQDLLVRQFAAVLAEG